MASPKTMTLLVEWIKQPSTIKGIITLLGTLGFTLTAPQVNLIAVVALSAYGLYQTFRNEDKQIEKAAEKKIDYDALIQRLLEKRKSTTS